MEIATMNRNKINTNFPPQHQDNQPGNSQDMNPAPQTDNKNYKPAQKLKDKVAVITGGDSGIGQAIAIAFAKEGADVVITYFSESQDAQNTVQAVEFHGRNCLSLKCNLKDENEAQQLVQQTLNRFGKVDILVNNIAVQFPQNSILDITYEQLSNTFQTNIFSYFLVTKAILPHLTSGSSIINTTSVSAYEGSADLLDYSASKGAIVSFTRSLALSLASQNIRVNAVSPGPVWTPLIVSSFSEEKVSQFGKNTKMGRAAQPYELAPTYVYLACEDSSFVTGQVIHVNGGTITES